MVDAPTFGEQDNARPPEEWGQLRGLAAGGTAASEALAYHRDDLTVALSAEGVLPD